MIRGVPQLQKLVVRYCPHGGSSRGARAFVFEEFAKFAEANPAVECRSELGRGKHPVVRGSYVWGDDKVLDCKNRSSADVLKMAEVLRNSSGRKMLRFEKPVVSEKPSIQGPALGGAPPQVWVLPEKTRPAPCCDGIRDCVLTVTQIPSEFGPIGDGRWAYDLGLPDRAEIQLNFTIRRSVGEV